METDSMILSDRLSDKSSKTALVLAGGGLTGAVYEIGALRDRRFVDQPHGQ